MRAHTGDWLLIEGHSVGHVVRRGLIVSVEGHDGAPPYVVHWTDSDRQVTVFPGPDARVVSAEDLAAHDSVERDRIDRVRSTIAHHG